MRGAPIALWVLLGGCSLMGLDDFELAECTSDEDCAGAGRRPGDHDECRRSYCEESTGLCRAHQGEGCDGLDNDCDRIIDEGATRRSAARRVTGVDTTRIGYAPGLDGRVAAAWATGAGTASYALLPITDERMGAPLRYSMLGSEVDLPDGTNLMEVALTSDDRCPSLDAAADDVSPGTCDFGDVAIAMWERTALLATINTRGCPAGQLRVGHLDRDDASDPDVVLRGPRRRSSSYLGIGPCDPTATGVARPSVAVLDDPGAAVPQALVAWIAAAASRDECGGEAAEVRAVTAHLLESTRLAEPFSWVDVSGEGEPELLGTTRGGGAPAVASLSDLGYLVAFPGAAGGIRLSFVPRAADPPSWDGVSGDPTDRTGVETPALSGIVEVATLDAEGADHVVLAPGAVRDGEVAVTVAWREGCAAGSRTIHARMVTLDVSGTPELGDAGDAIEVARGAALGPPGAAWSGSGFAVPGLERNGRTATAASTGGSVVAWTDGMRLDAVRISEMDGALLVPDERVALLGEGGAEEPRPALYLDAANTLRFIHVQRDDAIVEGPALCTSE